jgi:hypothetical protein
MALLLSGLFTQFAFLRHLSGFSLIRGPHAAPSLCLPDNIVQEVHMQNGKMYMRGH